MSGATQAWRLGVGNARHAWLGSSLPAFLRWWAGELLALLPAHWRAWFRSGADWYLLQPVGAGWTLRRVGMATPYLVWDDTIEASAQTAELQHILGAVDPARVVAWWRDELGDGPFVATFLPPDMEWLRDWEALRKDGKIPEGSDLVQLVERRIAWEVWSEYTFKSRIGRTLEKSGSSALLPRSEAIEAAVAKLLPVLQEEIGVLRGLDAETLRRLVAGFIAALKNKEIDARQMAPAIASMKQLNRLDLTAALHAAVHAATDVTGFGVLGHALHIAQGSGVTLQLNTEAVPLLDGARETLERGILTKAHGTNTRYVQAEVGGREEIADLRWLGLVDPQTSGGLLLSVAPEHADALLEHIRPSFPMASAIGTVTTRGPNAIRVR